MTPTSSEPAYRDRRGHPQSVLRQRACTGLPASVQLVDVPLHFDHRGSLAAAELAEILPFTPARYFVVFQVPSENIRGEHAHRQCWQFLTCLTGQFTVHLDDGRTQADVVLDTPGMGVVIPPLVWASQYNYSADSVLVVLASHRYDPDDYIRDYREFRALVARDHSG
jgi:UDP-2-acetamido-3-amino-2,3-dideoxy-glucuronate N-acetyltransferase